MPVNLTREIAISRINQKIQEINSNHNKNLVFKGILNDEWKGSNFSKLIILCKKHNEICYPLYSNFIRSNNFNCPECIKESVSLRRKTTPDQAQELVNKKFKNDSRGYNYSHIKESFTGYDNNVIIICPVHGKFEIIYSSLISNKPNAGQCPLCTKERFTEKDAINKINIKLQELKEKGKDIEFLGFVDDCWEGNNTKLILRCNIHNYTWTTTGYNNFINSKFVGGCKFCKSEATINTHQYTPKQARDIVEKIHENDSFKYDYSPIETTYTCSSRPVTVICPIHGEFQIKYTTLTLGPNKGICPTCRKEQNAERRKIPEDKCIQMAKDRVKYLNNKYNISLEFIGFNTTGKDFLFSEAKIILKCNTHNIVWDTTLLSNFIHVDGIYCPSCSRTGYYSGKENECYELIKQYVPEDDILRQFRIFEESIENQSRTVYVDFLIRSKNIFIEYDGGQHDRYIEFFYDDYQDFVNRVNRDLWLEKYCKSRGITLLKISWKDNNKLEEVFRSFFLEGKDITTKVSPKLLPVPYDQNLVDSYGQSIIK